MYPKKVHHATWENGLHGFKCSTCNVSLVSPPQLIIHNNVLFLEKKNSTELKLGEQVQHFSLSHSCKASPPAKWCVGQLLFITTTCPSVSKAPCTVVMHSTPFRPAGKLTVMLGQIWIQYTFLPKEHGHIKVLHDAALLNYAHKKKFTSSFWNEDSH